jgi:hypothetical protein
MSDSRRTFRGWNGTLDDMTVTQGIKQAFEVRAIDPEVLEELRVIDDADHPPVVSIDQHGGSPLRCCLRRSRPGERVALLSYAPLRRWARQAGAEPGPYDEVGPVFIHPERCAGQAETGYPAEFAGTRRMLRCYSADGRIRHGRLVEADEVRDLVAAGRLLEQVFADPKVAVVHARAVEFGCFTFEVRRAALEPAAS